MKIVRPQGSTEGGDRPSPVAVIGRRRARLLGGAAANGGMPDLRTADSVRVPVILWDEAGTAGFPAAPGK